MHVQATECDSLRQELQALRARVEELEQSLIRTQRLATVGQLASRMAHEFNNILTLIIGRAQHALKHDEPDLKEKALAKCLDSGQRAADIISSLLGYATGRRNQSELVPADALVESAAALIAWDLPKDGIELVRRYESRARVRVVRGRIEQVLLNLMLNARKAMSKRGGTMEVTVSPADTEGYVALRVRDTGCGIPPENLPRIFEAFFTAGPNGGGGREAGGTGLGLPVARDLVRQAGGEMHVESAPGIGSTFTVLLPAADEPVQ